MRRSDGSFDQRKVEEIWHEYDVDGNGYLDDQDLEALLINMFPFDTLRAEYEEIGAEPEWIKKKEVAFEARLKSLAAHMRGAMDRNGDGVVDKKEFCSFFDRAFGDS